MHFPLRFQHQLHRDALQFLGIIRVHQFKIRFNTILRIIQQGIFSEDTAKETIDGSDGCIFQFFDLLCPPLFYMATTLHLEFLQEFHEPGFQFARGFLGESDGDNIFDGKSRRRAGCEFVFIRRTVLL